jgi:hypothetical protein
MKSRDWVMLASGAALSAVAVVTIYEGGAHVAGPDPQVTREDVQTLQPSSNEPTRELRSDGIEVPPTGSPAAPRPSPRGGANTETPAASQLEHIRGKLQEVQREKRDLEAQLLTLEGELNERASSVPGGDPAEYDLDREDWKELAAKGRIKYRIPCLSSNGGAWQTSQPQLDKLGLSPEDGEAIREAHRRSNARVWETVRPHCVKASGDAAVADRLGADGCITLIEQTAPATDPMAIFNAQRQVAEVHAGIRPPPEAGQAQSPVFDAYLALTSEARLFEADLAQHFGPEEAKRLIESLPCVATRR